MQEFAITAAAIIEKKNYYNAKVVTAQFHPFYTFTGNFQKVGCTVFKLSSQGTMTRAIPETYFNICFEDNACL